MGCAITISLQFPKGFGVNWMSLYHMKCLLWCFLCGHVSFLPQSKDLMNQS